MRFAGFSERAWQLSAASVLGKSHVDGGLPNQDAFALCTDPSGEIVCAVVSDGAGTADRSAEGSRFAADFIAQRMCLVARAHSPGLAVADLVRREFADCIAKVRQRLAPESGSLRDFHCTMVAWLNMPDGAFIAQIGDSVALATQFAWIDPGGQRQANFFPDGRYRLFEVERGEYANETHFLTEEGWESHLRVVQVPPDADAIVLMTDGAMDIAMLKGEVFRGFLANLVGKLIATPEFAERDATIHAWLDDPQTYSVTGDDKTMLVAVRQQKKNFAGAPVYVGTSLPVIAQAATMPPPAVLPGVMPQPALLGVPPPSGPPIPRGSKAPGTRATPAAPAGPVIPPILQASPIPPIPPGSGRWAWRALAGVAIFLAGGAAVHFFQQAFEDNGFFARRQPGASEPRQDKSVSSRIPAAGLPETWPPQPPASAMAARPAASEAAAQPAASAGAVSPMVARAPATPRLRVASEPDAAPLPAARSGISVWPQDNTRKLKDGHAAFLLTLKQEKRPLEIVNILLPQQLQLENSLQKHCRVGVVLDSQRKGCELAVRVGAGTLPGSFRVKVEYQFLEEKQAPPLELDFIQPPPKEQLADKAKGRKP